eukprot:scaffold3677_cov206-Amphora_coffeaeformis.AAC.7
MSDTITAAEKKKRAVEYKNFQITHGEVSLWCRDCRKRSMADIMADDSGGEVEEEEDAPLPPRILRIEVVVVVVVVVVGGGGGGGAVPKMEVVVAVVVDDDVGIACSRETTVVAIL